ncbi:MAG TPA: Crp/Fnr family transcriptional regulator [Blastocatellia bacterium]|nr:Crp/Fnr family transcriptional regulator [Blastocatellia bacterium]
MTSQRNSLQAAIVRSLAESIVFPAIDDLLPAGQTPEDSLRINMRRSRRVKAGQLIFPCESSGPALVVLIRGEAEMFYPSRSAPFFSKLLAPGHMLGDVGPFRGATLSGEAVAKVDCRIVVLSVFQTEEIEAPAEVQPRWYRRAFDRLAAFQGECLRALHGAPTPPLSALLMETAGEDGVIAGVTQRQIAEMLGLHRGSVNRALSRLKQQGLIEVKREKITVLNAEGLRAVAAGGPGSAN